MINQYEICSKDDYLLYKKHFRSTVNVLGMSKDVNMVGDA